MSVIVSGVSKFYGNQKALNDVSFSINKGDILGFLGPNGAGKSTMMKIITTYLMPSAGKVDVCGFDVTVSPMEVRKRVGYLPEHNPLYLDMYVREYLEFIAGLHKLKRPSKRINEMIDITGLGLEKHKKIAELSKGYRQRVGLAQAIIHDPEVLILDEPTSGLDPNQLTEIRSLIKNLGKEKTVMFSTHILQEAEAICDRIIIINKGNIVADEPVDKLQHRSTGTRVIVEFSELTDVSLLKKIEGVKQVKPGKKNSWILTANEEIDIRPAVFKFAVEHHLTVLTISHEDVNLEQIFRDFTLPDA